MFAAMMIGFALCTASASWFPEEVLKPGGSYDIDANLVDVMLVQVVGIDNGVSFQVTTAPVRECGDQKFVLPHNCPPGKYRLIGEAYPCEARCASWRLSPKFVEVPE